MASEGILRWSRVPLNEPAPSRRRPVPPCGLASGPRSILQGAPHDYPIGVGADRVAWGAPFRRERAGGGRKGGAGGGDPRREGASRVDEVAPTRRGPSVKGGRGR